MEGNQPTSRGAGKAAKSAHVIDLRRSAGGAATAEPPASKPRIRGSRPAGRRPSKPALKPEKPVRSAVAVAKSQSPIKSAPSEDVPVAAAKTAPQAVPASAKPEFYETPTERRFWPAFWRFLLLLAILALIICVGVYVYLKFFNS